MSMNIGIASQVTGFSLYNRVCLISDHLGAQAARAGYKSPLLCGLLAILIFLVDIQIPLGVAGGVPYVLVILLATRSPQRKFIFVAAIFTSALTIFGYYLSPDGGELWKVMANRGLALFAIWVSAIAANAAFTNPHATLVERLQAQVRELELRNGDLDTYSGTVAHDLKSPLSNFLWYSDELREYHRSMSHQEIDQYLDTILMQSRKMNSIIDELLLLARVRMTEHVQIDELDMEQIVLGVLERLELDIRETNAQIVLPDDWHNACGYSPWVEGIWYNYLTNGLKYGGEPPCLTLGSSLSADNKVWYWIEDQGCGLSPEEQKKLFKPFPGIDRQDKRGNGLGLVIVSQIAEHLNGDVDVKSKVGKGSRFYFSLPYTLPTYQ